MLTGKKILIGITGSIAAYKIPLLVRLLKKEGAEDMVHVGDDMMVDMVHVGDDMLMNQYIMSLINNTFRVTFGHQCTSFYDLVIDSKKEDDVLKRIEILHDYLSMLLGKR